MNTTGPTLDMWRYYVGADYADPTLRADVAAQLEAADALAVETRELQGRHADAANSYAEARQHAPAQYAAAITSAKRKPTATDLDKRLTHLDADRQQLERQLRIVTGATTVVLGTLHRLLAANSQQLLRWVAQHREAAGLAVCGDVMPDAVLRMHAALDVPLDPRWHESLDVPARHTPATSSRQLPLVWQATMPAKQRASLAWVWQQLAAGDVRWVSVSAQHYPGIARTNRPRRALQLTGDPGDLPYAPDVPAAAPRRRAAHAVVGVFAPTD